MKERVEGVGRNGDLDKKRKKGKQKTKNKNKNKNKKFKKKNNKKRKKKRKKNVMRRVVESNEAESKETSALQTTTKAAPSFLL